MGRDQRTVAVSWREQRANCEVVERIETGERPIDALSPWPDLTILRIPDGEFVVGSGGPGQLTQKLRSKLVDRLPHDDPGFTALRTWLQR